MNLWTEFEEFVEQIRRATGMLEGYGAKNIRWLAGLVAGQQTGTIVVSKEFDDFAAFGAFEDKVLADPQIRELLSTGADSPMSGFQTSLFVDVTLWAQVAHSQARLITWRAAAFADHRLLLDAQAIAGRSRWSCR
jgi:hypothetical protein